MSTIRAEYGWIEPARNVLRTYPGFAPISQIHRFWEKPTPALGRELYERGCLWNSFVLIADLKTLVLLIAKALPELYRGLAGARRAFASDRKEEILHDVYQHLPTTISGARYWPGFQRIRRHAGFRDRLERSRRCEAPPRSHPSVWHGISKREAYQCLVEMYPIISDYRLILHFEDGR